MSVTLRFHGGASTVTGSKTWVSDGRRDVLVDCGMFQGLKALRRRNWDAPPFEADALDAVLITHAHIDHLGWLPALVARGFRGPVFTTSGTAALASILLRDAAHLQEEEAERANRRGTSKHRPARPLFTVEEAERALEQLEVVRTHTAVRVVEGVEATFLDAGHILGAAQITLSLGGRRIHFSGDLGRADDPLHGAPDPLPDGLDALVIESTYGGRAHGEDDVEAVLGEVVRTTVARGGHVMIPAFAVGRTQRILYHLLRLRRAGAIPDVPVFLNSPLASKATRIFEDHPEGHALPPREARALADLPIVVEDREDSIALNRRKEPCVILAGSGMATGGRIVHHLMAYARDPRHTLLFTGYQAPGTRGDRILRGAPRVRIFGEDVAIRCEVAVLDMLSAHADQGELVDWVTASRVRPDRVFVNHGSPEAADALRLALAPHLPREPEAPWMGDAAEV